MNEWMHDGLLPFMGTSSSSSSARNPLRSVLVREEIDNISYPIQDGRRDVGHDSTRIHKIHVLLLFLNQILPIIIIIIVIIDATTRRRKE